jgi:squalene-hopene/tetraprenyl-beta-curcumene cyclase
VRDLRAGVEKLAAHLVGLQSEEGWWKGTLETNVTMEAEDLLLREFLGIRDEQILRMTANHIRSRQNGDGGWPVYYGGPSDLSTTVEAYVALRVAGDSPSAPHMDKALSFIREHGGAEASRVFTRLWLALFGLVAWDDLPTLPPELMFIPPSMPLSIYDFACWARQTVVALTLVYAHRPARRLPVEVPEIFVGRAGAKRPASPIGRAFEVLDRCLKVYERHLVRIPPFRNLRRLALALAREWVVRRQEADGSWGGIQPPWVYSLIGLHLEGYPIDHPVMRRGIEGIEGFSVIEGDRRMVEACQSPVWDTALAVWGLASWGEDMVRDAVEKAVRWLVDKEVTVRGDWAVRRPGLAPSGFSFEFENVNYPDVDDTAVVVLALHSALPLLSDRVLAERVRGVIERSWRWVVGMQSRSGGWGAFDADNTRELLKELPFCDFGEVIDPPSADVTAHAIEMLSTLGVADPAVRRGIRWLLGEQEADGAWFGRWGANYIYGTAAALCALAAAGRASSIEAERGRAFLVNHQSPEGGWGEDMRSYEDPEWRGRGEPTPSQTAWALMGLLTEEKGGECAGEQFEAVERGAEWLLSVQRDDGGFEEPYFTGVGFPRDFYINYHLYRLVFPMIALGKLERSRRQR